MEPPHAARGDWRPQYWLMAAAPALVLYVFYFFESVSLETIRAPNVSLAGQLAVMFLFHASWVFTPRLIWAARPQPSGERATRMARCISRLFAMGLGLSIIYMFALAVIMRAFYSPPGWGPGDLARSTYELWLGDGKIWGLLYALTSVVILRAARARPEPARLAAPAAGRMEARRNGKLHSIAVSEIFWIESAGNYVQLHTARGAFLLRKTLAAIEAELGDAFARSHRSALVNAGLVRAIKPDGGGYRIELAGGQTAPLGRRRLAAFKELLRATDCASAPIERGAARPPAP